MPGARAEWLHVVLFPTKPQHALSLPIGASLLDARSGLCSRLSDGAALLFRFTGYERRFVRTECGVLIDR